MSLFRNLFVKKCAWCGTGMKDTQPVQRIGKRFCSGEHAEEYLAHAKAAGEGGSGGCC